MSGGADHERTTAAVLRAMGLLVAGRSPRHGAGGAEAEAEAGAGAGAGSASAAGPGGFAWLCDPPPWAESFGCVPGGACDLAGSFAFMGLFLEDAEAYFATGRTGQTDAAGDDTATLRSAPWSEPDPLGVTHQLEAFALRLTDPAAEVVVVAGAGTDFAQTQSILQAARERRLAADRELAVRREVEAELRLRVEQRTADLGRSNVQLRELAAQVGLAEQRERHRLAIGLHDHVGQLLAAAKLRCAALRAAAAGGRAAGADLPGELTAVLGVLDRAISATRTLTFELSPPMLYELGLTATLASLVEQIARAHPALACACRDDGADKPLAGDLEVLLFQVARELINNVLKHANASRLTVTTRRDGDELCLTVSDDGAGFDPAVLERPVVGPGGFGLYSVRQRLAQRGAGLTVDTRPGAGTAATVRAPLTLD